ncbi:SsrA-binding protein SmpB [Enterobacteriaceae endosymbiont of Plateumaris pusilla]|uniref:SsrA-binding protein SmpB n=1 Tax=Enterobacteriaceae endosymbiont of Plateumaris pusilla TaxID=2675795 RepID=UPI00144927D4|nr:SsrA-binding protein SmpB [Enterobacteriaceae endosymbiont of Plateumaris pusilla]QJC29677.1 SsrA-binding protein SmpB [Enterobacteriaceae endosymbiont of Plateumaris pusilla]
MKKNYIILNKKIYHDFFIKEEIEAGIILQGWEVKSLRLNKITISNSYVSIFHNSTKVFLLNSNINPLNTICNHIKYNPIRKRELLLNKKEIFLLKNYLNCKGFTIVVIGLYWKKSWCKLKIAVVKGKKKYDKRHLLKKKEWNINKMRLIKKNIKI